MTKRRFRSTDAAVASLIQAAEAGAAEAAQELGDRYREGDGVDQSDTLALRWYSVGARLGDAEAQNNLGTMLLNGIGCDADAAAAVPWYQASAEQGNAVAQFNLGLRYLHGSGVEPDDLTAWDWIAKAAAQNYKEAIGQLGTLFRFGRGTDPDLLQAAQLHMVAAQAGDATSHGNLSDYRGDLIDMALAGNREAAFDLSRMYDSGLGGEKNKALCWAWVRWAHEGCAPMPGHEARTEDLDAEVAEAFRFFGVALTMEVRGRGDALFGDLLRKAGRAGVRPGTAKRKRETGQGPE